MAPEAAEALTTPPALEDPEPCNDETPADPVSTYGLVAMAFEEDLQAMNPNDDEDWRRAGEILHELMDLHDLYEDPEEALMRRALEEWKDPELRRDRLRREEREAKRARLKRSRAAT